MKFTVLQYLCNLLLSMSYPETVKPVLKSNFSRSSGHTAAKTRAIIPAMMSWSVVILFVSLMVTSVISSSPTVIR